MQTKSALRERLEAAVMERHCANHPLTEKWAAGKLSRNALMGWGIEQYHWISNIYRGELFKAANTPLAVQRLLLENYLEESDPRASSSGYHSPLCRRQRSRHRADQAKPGPADHGSMGDVFQSRLQRGVFHCECRGDKRRHRIPIASPLQQSAPRVA